MDSMRLPRSRHDRLLIFAAGATALGILTSLTADQNAFGGALACVGYGFTCLALHRIGRSGRVLSRPTQGPKPG